MNVDATIAMSAFLRYVDLRELHRRISEFRELNFRLMSYTEVHQAILDVITFDTPRGRVGLLNPVHNLGAPSRIEKKTPIGAAAKAAQEAEN